MANDLEFRIGAELSEIKGALASLQRDLQRTGQAAQQAGGNNAFKGLEGSLKGALGAAARLAAGFASVAAAISLIGEADELNTLNARLKIATSTTEEYIRAQQALFDLAQRSRSSLGETIELYSKIAGATKEAGVGQETLLQVVETINQAVQLSGASTQAAQAALQQLGQGLASGTLRGEELNSILEQTPALADAIAKGMGITRGELRKYGEDGKITAEQVIKALQAQREEVAKNFSTLPVTVGQSITQLKNSGLQLLGVFDATSGATGGLATVISDFAEFLSSPAVQGAIIEFGVIAKQYFDIAADAVKGAAAVIIAALDVLDVAVFAVLNDMANNFETFSDGLIQLPRTGREVVDLIIRAFKEMPANVRASIKILTVQAAASFDYLVSYAQFVKDNFKAIFTDDTQDAAFARFQSRNRAIGQAARDTVDEALDERSKALSQAAQARAEADRRRKLGQTNTGKNGTGTFKPGAAKDGEASKAAALAKARIDAEEKLADDSAKRQLSTLQQLFDDSKTAAADYYAKRQEIELASIDRSIELERKRVKAGGVEAIKALAEIEILERQKEDVRKKAQTDAAEFKTGLDKQLEQARIQDLENAGQAGEAARAKAEASFKDLLARLRAEGDTAGVALIERLINTDAARGQFDKLRADFDKVLADLQARQTQLANLRDTGALAPDTAAQQQSEARRQAMVELDALNQKLQTLAETTNDPRIVEGAQKASAAIQQLGVDSAVGIDAAIIGLRASLGQLQQDFAKTATGAGVDALTGLFTDLASGTKTAGEALADFARGFVASMAQIAARALATYLVLQLLEAVFPGAGKLLGAAGGATAGVKHTGGMVGSGGVTRSVNPLLFAGAPRYHSGGMVGLKPDERPAILQTGEEVLSRKDPRNAANSGGEQGGSGYRILNIMDPSLVSNYIESSAGEKTIMNIIGRNPSQVRQLIGS